MSFKKGTLFVILHIENIYNMKHILLIILFILLQISSYSQVSSGNSSDWNSYSAINSEKNQPDLKIYPNPCKDKKVTVEFNTDLISEIRLLNITGKEVFLKKIEIPVTRLQFELTNIPNGIYMVQVKTVDDKIIVKKLLVTSN